jgi:hypothetical protein
VTTTSWIEIAPGLFRDGYTTSTNIPSNTFALRLKDGELAVISPRCAPDDACFAATEALGRVTTIVAPNSGHDLGQAAWQAKYPEAAVHAPAVAIPAIAKAKPKLRAMQALSALASKLPHGVTLKDPEGTSSGIAQLAVESNGERVLFVDEAISNSPTLIGPAPFRLVFWLTGSGPGVARNKVWWWVFAKDRPGLAKQILGEMDRLKPTMLMPLHGDPITGEGIERVRELLRPIAG